MICGYPHFRKLPFNGCMSTLLQAWLSSSTFRWHHPPPLVSQPPVFHVFQGKTSPPAPRSRPTLDANLRKRPMCGRLERCTIRLCCSQIVQDVADFGWFWNADATYFSWCPSCLSSLESRAYYRAFASSWLLVAGVGKNGVRKILATP